MYDSSLHFMEEVVIAQDELISTYDVAKARSMAAPRGAQPPAGFERQADENIHSYCSPFMSDGQTHTIKIRLYSSVHHTSC